MKSPHDQRPDSEARELTEAFIAEHARKPMPKKAAKAKRRAKAAAQTSK